MAGARLLVTLLPANRPAGSGCSGCTGVPAPRADEYSHQPPSAIDRLNVECVAKFGSPVTACCTDSPTHTTRRRTKKNKKKKKKTKKTKKKKKKKKERGQTKDHVEQENNETPGKWQMSAGPSVLRLYEDTNQPGRSTLSSDTPTPPRPGACTTKVAALTAVPGVATMRRPLAAHFVS